MKDLLMDPVVLGCVAVIGVGFVLLVMAIRAVRKPSMTKQPAKEVDFPILRANPVEPLSVVSPDVNPFSANAVVPPPVAVANKDVLMKVDLISQRLVDMQMILNKQMTAAAAQRGNPGVSPDVLDKLIKITANVAQQVDILQKSMGGTAVSAGTAPDAAPPTPSSGQS